MIWVHGLQLPIVDGFLWLGQNPCSFRMLSASYIPSRAVASLHDIQCRILRLTLGLLLLLPSNLCNKHGVHVDKLQASRLLPYGTVHCNVSRRCPNTTGPYSRQEATVSIKSVYRRTPTVTSANRLRKDLCLFQSD